MASINDINTELVKANASLTVIDNRISDSNNDLQQLHGDITNLTAETIAVKNSVDTVDSHIQTLITLQLYADKALAHLAQQTDTVICLLDRIAKQTCDLLNEAHVQTSLQNLMSDNTSKLLEISQFAHPDAALESQRIENIRKQLLACCPEQPPEPICNFEPCEAPKPLDPPPQVDNRRVNRPK